MEDHKKQNDEIDFNITGKDVANALDFICLCVFYAAILVCLTGYKVYILALILIHLWGLCIGTRHIYLEASCWHDAGCALLCFVMV